LESSLEINRECPTDIVIGNHRKVTRKKLNSRVVTNTCVRHDFPHRHPLRRYTGSNDSSNQSYGPSRWQMARRPGYV